MIAPKNRVWLIGSIVALLMIGALTLLATIATHIGSALVVTALAKNSEAIGISIQIQIDRAVAIGLSVNDLVGVDAVFQTTLLRHKELSFIALVGSKDQVISLVSREAASPQELDEIHRRLTVRKFGEPKNLTIHVATTAISGGLAGEEKATLFVGYPANHINKQINALVVDMVIAVLIALILVAEFLRFFVRRSTFYEITRFREFTHHLKNGNFGHRVQSQLVDPTSILSLRMDERLDALRLHHQRLLKQIHHLSSHLTASTRPLKLQLSDIARQYSLSNEPKTTGSLGTSAQLRMMVFLVSLSEEICRPFFALHASNLSGPLALSSEVLAGIPLTTFLFTWAVSQPLGSAFLRQFSAKTCLTCAASLTALGMLLTAWTDSWAGLVFLRALTGIGFGCVLIFSQTIMLRIGRITGRAQSMAGFVGAVVAAGICGPVIGGLLAVKLGITTTFVIAACCALISIGFAWGTNNVPTMPTQVKLLSIEATLRAMRNARLLLLVVFSAVPGKLASTAVLMMLVPLATVEMGESIAMAGRLLLLFFLGFFLVSGLAAKLSDRWNARKPFIAIGSVLSALACISGYAIDNIWGLFATCFLLGLGQAWSSSPQIALITQLIESRGSAVDNELALGVYRLIERCGGALGPLMAALLIRQFGLGGAMLGFGIILTVGAFVTVFVLWEYKEKNVD